MADFRVEIDKNGVRELLQSEEMAAVLRKYGDSVQHRAGRGFYKDERSTGQRRVYTVTAVTKAAQNKNLKDNTLLKALGGGK